MEGLTITPDGKWLVCIGALGATPIAGKTIEQATVAEILEAGIIPATKWLRVDLAAAGFRRAELRLGVTVQAEVAM